MVQIINLRTLSDMELLRIVQAFRKVAKKKEGRHLNLMAKFISMISLFPMARTELLTKQVMPILRMVIKSLYQLSSQIMLMVEGSVRLVFRQPNKMSPKCL